MPHEPNQDVQVTSQNQQDSTSTESRSFSTLHKVGDIIAVSSKGQLASVHNNMIHNGNGVIIQINIICLSLQLMRNNRQLVNQNHLHCDPKLELDLRGIETIQTIVIAPYNLKR